MSGLADVIGSVRFITRMPETAALPSFKSNWEKWPRIFEQLNPVL